jgi:hypothetical protein
MRETPDVVLARMDERQKAMAEDVSVILIQVLATNGRVTKLESWRSQIKGVLIAVGVFCTLIGGSLALIVQLLTQR